MSSINNKYSSLCYFGKGCKPKNGKQCTFDHADVCRVRNCEHDCGHELHFTFTDVTNLVRLSDGRTMWMNPRPEKPAADSAAVLSKLAHKAGRKENTDELAVIGEKIDSAIEAQKKELNRLEQAKQRTVAYLVNIEEKNEQEPLLQVVHMPAPTPSVVVSLQAPARAAPKAPAPPAPQAPAPLAPPAPPAPAPPAPQAPAPAPVVSRGPNARAPMGATANPKMQLAVDGAAILAKAQSLKHVERKTLEEKALDSLKAIEKKKAETQAEIERLAADRATRPIVDPLKDRRPPRPNTDVTDRTLKIEPAVYPDLKNPLACVKRNSHVTEFGVPSRPSVANTALMFEFAAGKAAGIDAGLPLKPTAPAVVHCTNFLKAAADRKAARAAAPPAQAAASNDYQVAAYHALEDDDGMDLRSIVDGDDGPGAAAAADQPLAPGPSRGQAVVDPVTDALRLKRERMDALAAQLAALQAEKEADEQLARMEAEIAKLRAARQGK